MSKEEADANVADTMNEQQNKVVNAVLAGENVFFHGAAGTGKSFVLQISSLFFCGHTRRPPQSALEASRAGV